MNAFITSLLLFFSLFPLSLATTTIEDACKSIARADSFIPYNFCVTTLKSRQTLNHYPNRLSVHSLADIAIGVTKHFAHEIYGKVSDLVMNVRLGLARTRKEMLIRDVETAKKRRYHQCSEIYMEVEMNLNEAAVKISKKRYAKAKELVRAASGASRRCVRLYRGTGHLREFPLLKTDRLYFDRVLKLTEAILSMALQ